MKTRNSEQYTSLELKRRALLYSRVSYNVVPVLDNRQKNIMFCDENKTIYLPIPWKKFRLRKHKSKKWHKRRQDKISEYVMNYLKGLGVKEA